MPIDDLPIIEIVIRQLARAGFDRLIITTGHLAEMLRLFCGDGRKWGIRIDYSDEAEPLGTAGPIGQLADDLDENFLVMNGDLLTTLNYRRAFEWHLRGQTLATVALYQREVKIDFGVIEERPSGFLDNYVEKPTMRFSVSMGINFLSRGVLKYMERGKRLDIPDLMLRLRAAGKKIACYKEDCYWLDIGRADDYQTATEEFIKRRKEFLPDYP